MSDHDPRLEPVLDCVRELGHEPQLGPTTDLLGGTAFAGCHRPAVSSAARLSVGGHAVWIPSPVPECDGDGPAAVFRYAGREHVFPVVRLCSGEGKKIAREYLTLADWLRDAIARWEFFDREKALRATVRTQLAVRSPALVVRAVGRLVWYALFGGSAGPKSSFAGDTGLVLPARPAWVRPGKETDLGRLAATFQVMTAKFDGTVPTAAVRGKDYRVRPTAADDRGIDPVHTPEGEHVRLTGYLGAGVTVEGRKLVHPGDGPPLSVSTGRIPYAGYDDPRRLLMAAGMQTHAVELVEGESPRVRTAAPGIDPPGVNLRVGYLAWRGLNHEDAWVLSESAARKLACRHEITRTLAVSAVELPPTGVVSRGQAVRRGEPLLRRRAAAALLVVKPDPDWAGGGEPGVVALDPGPEDRAPWDGTVGAVEVWNLVAGDGVPPGTEIPDGVRAAVRMLVRVTLSRTRPLEVGDKLANRHGHKGVVGAILPDAGMPRWRDEPLDVLLDPIGVLNRSNWGQLREALAGATTEVPVVEPDVEQVLASARLLNADAAGRWEVEPPLSGEWLAKPVRAFAGVQFVMRLPHFARDRISASPAPRGFRVKRRAQRFGEMDSWAAWAHDALAPPSETPGLNPDAARFRGLLAAAGFALQLDPTAGILRVRRLALDGDPPTDAMRIPLPGTRPAAARKLLDAANDNPPAVLVFDPPITGVRPPGQRKADEPEPPPLTIRWLPVSPIPARPPRRLADGSTAPHELTVRLRAVIRAAHAEDAEALGRAVGAVLASAYRLAVGTRPTGFGSSKFSALRREVFGQRVGRSGRAVIAPGGPLDLAPDEIGLPEPLALALFGRADDLDRERLWLKRDPVLHRWGLLPVRARVVPGNAIRLPASILGPMGADYDGDAVAVFATLPGVRFPAGPFAALAADPILKRDMFVPGKQYRRGFHLLGCAPDYRRERDALAALAADPGMGLGLLSAAELTELPAVACKASKFAADGAGHILMGRSLEIYGPPADPVTPPADPIADVMVAARSAVGKFGGVLRRILFAVPSLDGEAVRHAHCLTEAMTQKVLSVKAGAEPLRFTEFDAAVRERLKLPRRKGKSKPSPAMAAVLAELEPCLAHLGARATGGPPDWLGWLKNPHELAQLLPVGSSASLELPLDDLRVRSFVTG